ncbi:pre-mRNA cleavage and polyadenylation factor (CPF) complex subunit, partial [Teratosphaeriaceae sp. CCFEE 6253]
MSDRWHIGQEAAEAQGTYKRAEAQRQQQEEEMEDEEEGLVDQKMPAQLPGLTGISMLPGLAKPAPQSHPVGINPERLSMIDMPGFANAPPAPPGLDLEMLKKMFGGQLPPPPLASGAMPPMPNFGNAVPPLPQGFVPPPGFPMPGLPGIGGQSPTPTNGA